MKNITMNGQNDGSDDRSDGSSSPETPNPADPPRPQDAMNGGPHSPSRKDSAPRPQDAMNAPHAGGTPMGNGGPADSTHHPQRPSSTSSTYADAVMNGIHDPMTNLAVRSPAGTPGRPPLPRIQETAQAAPTPPIPPQQRQRPPIPPHRQQHPQFSVQITVPADRPLSQAGGEHTAEGERTAEQGRAMSIDGSNTPMSVSSELGRANTPGAMSLSDMLSEDVAGEGGGGGPSVAASSGAAAAHDVRQQSQGQSQGNGVGNHAANIAQQPVAPSTPPVAAPGMEATAAATAAHESSSEDDLQLTPRRSHTTFKSPELSSKQRYVRAPTLERLSYILRRGSLVMINFSQRNLGHRDAELIRSAIVSNPQLSVLKLGYNNLGDVGADLIASAIHNGGANDGIMGAVTAADSRGSLSSRGSLEMMGGDEKKRASEPMLESRQQQQLRQHQQRRQNRGSHHPSLSVLDLGFNNIGDTGCASLATHAVSHNPALSTLYLSGNAIRERGALSLAAVVAGGCGLTSLHLTANRIGPGGARGLTRAMAEFDVTMAMAHQDRENRMALEEERKQQEERRKSENDMGGEGNGDGDDVDLESLGINDDSENDDKSGVEEADDLSRLRGYKCMEELHLGGTHLESAGCLSVSNMLLTNLSLRVICLSDNQLDDQDLSLFSQSLSRNRELPLEVLRLSFNRLTCAGVETLMNAIWGSKTLREIKLDNNQIRDRGAQLAAVVLTSVDLEVLDMGFNRLTIVGIKALMKSLAENRTLRTLTLSGNVLDTNASKAVSYALAYNGTVRKLYVDHCSLSYAAQRHIAAGIVSNSNLALRVMSGFPLGAISVTLGLPGAMETWSNEQVLKFIRVMWDRHRHQKEAALFKISLRENSTHSMSTAGSRTASSTDGGGSIVNNPAGAGGPASSSDKPAAATEQPKSGPSDPATVVAAAKSAFEALGDAGGALLLTEEPQRAISESSPMVSSDAVMLEKTPSGTIRVPSLDDESGDEDNNESRNNNIKPNVRLDLSVPRSSTDSLCTANGTVCPETPVDPAAKRRTMEWLRLHFRSLNEMTQLPYAYADLLQLYRYFYSPAAVDSGNDNGGNGGDNNGGDHPAGSVQDGGGGGGMPPPGARLGPGFNHGIINNNHNNASDQQQHPTSSNIVQTKPPPNKLSGLQRKISYRGLHDVMMGQHHGPSSNFSAQENTSKRRPVVFDPSMQPETKRARSGKPRIDYFPRLKAQIEQYLSSSKQTKALVLLRQLKFVETTMFHGANPYCDNQSSQSTTSATNADNADAKRSGNSSEPLATDVEVILIDML